MTLCNMSIEAGSRVGMIAPDETTFAYLKGRPLAPKGAHGTRRSPIGASLRTDDDAVFDREVAFDVSSLVSPSLLGHDAGGERADHGTVPDPMAEADPERRERMQRSLSYMGLCTRYAGSRDHHRPRLHRLLHQ